MSGAAVSLHSPVPVIPRSHLVFDTSPNSPDIIGGGQFGTVYRATWYKHVLQNGQNNQSDYMSTQTEQVAVKVIQRNNVASNYQRKFNKEVAVSSKTQAQVKLYGICMDEPSCLMVVMELIPEGSLDLFVRRERLSWSLRIELMRGMALAIESLHNHSPPIYHRDIKPDNFLVKCQRDHRINIIPNTLQVLISDMGSADTTWTNESLTALQPVGTWRYGAPEYILESSSTFTPQCDIYSLGMSCYYVITGYEPWHDRKHDVIVSLLLAQKRPQLDMTNIPQQYHDILSNMINKCWHHEPSQRYTSVTQARQILDGLYMSSLSAHYGSVSSHAPSSLSNYHVNNYVPLPAEAMAVVSSPTTATPVSDPQPLSVSNAYVNLSNEAFAAAHDNTNTHTKPQFTQVETSTETFTSTPTSAFTSQSTSMSTSTSSTSTIPAAPTSLSTTETSTSTSTRLRKFKVVLLGSQGVGKTCIMQRLVYNTFGRTEVTIGAAFAEKLVPVGNQTACFLLWDTAGQGEFLFCSDISV